MVSFNDIHQMKDGKWLVKGICFDGDALPQSLNVEIACGSEIEEVDTGNTYFYLLIEADNQARWINKKWLNFSTGKYNYIYPKSEAESMDGLRFWSGMTTSNILLPNFTPKGTDFNDHIQWEQFNSGNLIICAPIIPEINYWTVTYYEGNSNEGVLYITSETVEDGMYPQNVPQGYTWEGTYPGDVQIFSDQDFYGQPEDPGEEEEKISYRYPVNAYEYLADGYSGESVDMATVESDIFIPEGASLVDWSPVEDEGTGETQYYKPIIESDHMYLYYYPTTEEEYYSAGSGVGWSGLEYVDNEPHLSNDSYTPADIYIPYGYYLSYWDYVGSSIPHYTPRYDDEPGQGDEPDAWSSPIVGSLHEGSNEITLSPGQWVRYSFTTPSDISYLACSSNFMPSDVKCILFNESADILIEIEDNNEEDLDFSFEQSEGIYPDSTYYFALYLHPGGEEVVDNNASGTITIETGL